MEFGGQIIAVILILLKFFLNPERIKEKKKEKIKKERKEISNEIDKHIAEFDADMLAVDLDFLLQDE